MLHRSFKPAKCKTALRLAVSRIKLLKNKKEAVYKQQKREVSQLLESGQDRTARIRVEHVVREEKTMAAYELIEIYCELIVARLPIIESQKNCPIDLKEAITSVIFASPRCADLPELLDIRKHFTAKYGKEFITSAVELRPNCGVNRMLVEKLSANAPDIQTKIKVLSAIAEEHNIQWDPNSLGEIDGKPADDLLNGPNNFQNASKMHVETPDVQAPPPRNQKQDLPVNPNEHNRNSSLSSQTLASTDVGFSKVTSASAHPESPSRIGAERVECGHSFSGEGNNFSLGRQNWNMEFKDATSAAQAAAEAAERASMAARAAAELSSRGDITRQYSNESEKSSVYGIRGEGRQIHAGSKLQGDNSVNNSFQGTNSRVHNGQDGNGKDNLAGGPERMYSHSRKSSRSASLKSSTASPDNDILVNSPQKADGYSQMSPSRVRVVKPNSGDFYGEGAMEEQSSKSNGTGNQDGIKTDNFGSFGEERLRKQSSSTSSRSHSSNSGDAHDFVLNAIHEKFENDIGQDLFVGGDHDNIQTDNKHAHSYDHASLVFDESGSDDDDSRFSVEDNYSRQESTFFTSAGRKSPIHLSENWNTSTSMQNRSNSPGKSISKSHLFTEPPQVSEGVTKFEVPSEPDELLPLTFDHSDCPSSESEEELVKSELGGKEYNAESQKRSGFGVSPTNQSSARLGKSQMDYDDMDRKSFYSEFDEEKPRRSSKLSSVRENKYNFQTAETHHAMKSNELLSQSSLDDSNELNFPVLTGGLRNKGYRRPPYTRGSSNNASSSSKPAIEETSAPILEFPNSQSHKGIRGDEKLNTRAVVTSSDSDSDDFNQEPTTQKAGVKLSSETSSKMQGMYFDSDDGDLEEDFPQQNLPSKAHLGGGFSRRTRGSPSLSEKSSYSKVKVSAEGPVSSGHGTERRPSKISYATENKKSTEQTTSKPTPELKNSFHEERLRTSAIEKPSSFSKVKVSAEGSVSSGHGAERRPSKFSYATEKPSSIEQITSKPMPELKNSLHEERLRTSTFEKPSSFSKVKVSAEGSVSSGHGAERRPSKISYTTEKPSSTEQTTSKSMPELKNPLHEERFKTSAIEKSSSSSFSGKTESLKTSSSSEKIPSRENSIKKASHVHPKLPDFDSITAHMQSLRTDKK